MSIADSAGAESGTRVDARRNRRVLLEAAAAAFVEVGVGASTRDIAARAGVGMGTLYRHFPTRSDLVVAVYRHQVDSCAEAGPALLARCSSADVALHEWVDRFVDFLVTKHGLAEALRDDEDGSSALHQYFVERLVPVCDQLLAAARARRGESRISAFALLRGIGNLCIGGAQPQYQPRDLAALLVDGALLTPGDKAPRAAAGARPL